MSFTWFPGHMRKALRRIEADAAQVDVVLVVLDARMPGTSRNALLEDTLRKKGKKLIYVLHKADLADGPATAAWLARLRREGDAAVAVSSANGHGKSELLAQLRRHHDAVVAVAQRRGLLTDVLRVMTVGIPNVGKSTLINKLSGTGRARTGRKPGLTRGPQYVLLSDGIELLDTPGVMPPGVLGDRSLLPLAVTGTIREDILPLDDLLPLMLSLLRTKQRLQTVLPGPAGTEPEWFERLCRSRGFLLKGAELDVRRATLYLLKGLREGRWGTITLEDPEGV